MATTKNVRYNIRLLVGNSSQETLQQQLKKHAVKKKYSGVYLMYLKLSDTKI